MEFRVKFGNFEMEMDIAGIVTVCVTIIFICLMIASVISSFVK